MLVSCQTHFNSRQAMIDYVAELSSCPSASASHWLGGGQAAQSALKAVDVTAYAATRNELTGKVSHLSPYLRHGIITSKQLLDTIDKHTTRTQSEKFVQQLSWRAFFHQVHLAKPETIWQDCEAYKTGFSARDYAAQLPDDIIQGKTGLRIIDEMIDTLVNTGYLHNHCRLYLASYVVHWRKIRWQAGAHWFLQHLLDGDIAVNNYSWQWVASTFSAKPYIFNLDNLRKFSKGILTTEDASNRPFDLSYEALNSKLFPHLSEHSAGSHP